MHRVLRPTVWPENMCFAGKTGKPTQPEWQWTSEHARPASSGTLYYVITNYHALVQTT
jgi:hypothetical protein